ncbi:AgmX/PglI C-terminal domain-containing protein [Corallococcus sp. EGB]|uniref:AgmX/PglI C-terminal domain-containing protein n=1 Tax=Corallococcus sp. EGB TaxID=1521117 RepID=UPI001CBFC518|nr:AgmX/PglI C-terminal domain-containing protein [Corallococcus sp. EGB]
MRKLLPLFVVLALGLVLLARHWRAWESQVPAVTEAARPVRATAPAVEPGGTRAPQTDGGGILVLPALTPASQLGAAYSIGTSGEPAREDPSGGLEASGPSPVKAVKAVEETTVRKEDIRTAIQDVRPGLQKCYAPVAERGVGDQRVVVRFTLVGQGTQGSFQDADIIESTLNDPLFLSCLLTELSQARFRAPWGTGVVTITYPFVFQSLARDGG